MGQYETKLAGAPPRRDAYHAVGCVQAGNDVATIMMATTQGGQQEQRGDRSEDTTTVVNK